MSVTISIRFLTGRAHLHPWQTHHSEGRVEWPPSHWRLLRALVAVAGRGLTSLPLPDFVVNPGKKPKATKKNPHPTWPPAGYVPLPDNWHSQANDEIPLSRLARLLHGLAATPTIWLPKTSGGHTRQYLPIHSSGMVRNSGSTVFDTFAALRKDQPLLFLWPAIQLDEQTQADLKLLLSRMTYFGRAESWCQAEAHICPPEHIRAAGFGQIVSAQTHWECVCIEDQGSPQGKEEYRDYLLERRLAPVRESHARFDEALRLFSALKAPKKLEASKSLNKVPQLGEFDWSRWAGRIKVVDGKLVALGYWTQSEIQELCDQFVEKDERNLVQQLLSNCIKQQLEFETWQTAFRQSTHQIMLLRCLLRESGRDIKDGLERPIGTRWVHYAVPRAIYDVPLPKPQPRQRTWESVDLVRYALNTVTAHRPVLPALTDTLLVADKFRSAALAVYGEMPGKRKLCEKGNYQKDEEFPRALCGHARDGKPCQGHEHAFWWPLDEDNDGFIDHVIVWAPGGFQQREIDALRRLIRLRQRGGRPDLLVTPAFVGRKSDYELWQASCDGERQAVFVSATPYFCPVHLGHGRGKSGRIRSLRDAVVKSLQLHGVVNAHADVMEIREIVFDYVPEELDCVVKAVNSHQIAEPIPPRQFFPVVNAPLEYPPLPNLAITANGRYRGAVLKDPDKGYCFGNSVGLLVDQGSRFIRALSFCRRRRGHEVRGRGRMLQITFRESRSPAPFTIGDQSHFGLGLFVPAKKGERE